MDWPKKFNGIGDTVRRAALNEFNVEAILKTTLLPGQQKTAYHGGLITTDYYVFQFQSLTHPNQSGSFCCGEHAAQGWFNLTHQNTDLIPSYNPITGASRGGGAGGGNGGNGNVQNPVNRDMRNLIKCLMTYVSFTDNTLNSSGGESSAIRVLNGLLQNINNPPTVSQIRSVNTILAKTFQNPKYVALNIKTYSDLVAYKEQQHGVTIKKINIAPFNLHIQNNRNNSPTYTYPHPASF
ncbi:hypothetical protein [Enterobacter kobei]|uniref:hypothetical protein n=1 Tax=Enterobacter kobei TaxID=208224 RepID=UPI0021BE3EC0|nr:hypothetical protein [Enterobacter kobei]UXJ66730.1 hypothetical protein N5P26_22955 [Enterobacter kobei]